MAIADSMLIARLLAGGQTQYPDQNDPMQYGMGGLLERQQEMMKNPYRWGQQEGDKTRNNNLDNELKYWQKFYYKTPWGS